MSPNDTTVQRESSSSSSGGSEPELVEEEEEETPSSNGVGDREAALESRVVHLETSLKQVLQLLQEQQQQQTAPPSGNVSDGGSISSGVSRPPLYRAYSPSYEEGLRREIRSRSNSAVNEELRDKENKQPLSSSSANGGNNDVHTAMDSSSASSITNNNGINSTDNNNSTNSINAADEKMTTIRSTASPLSESGANSNNNNPAASTINRPHNNINNERQTTNTTNNAVSAVRTPGGGKPPRTPSKKEAAAATEDKRSSVAKPTSTKISASVSAEHSQGSTNGASSQSKSNPSHQTDSGVNGTSIDVEKQTKHSSILNYVQTEMLGEGGNDTESKVVSGHAAQSLHEIDYNMEEFRRIPYEFERLMIFGLAICFDSYLYVFTFLPLRFAWSLFRLAVTAVYPRSRRFQFHRRHMYQIYQVSIILLVYRSILSPVPIGMLYHWIRGQTILKLYIVIAMVEVFDRLLSAFGQDAMDSMYWNTMVRPKSRRLLVSWCVVLVYASAHSLVLFVHVAALNVAMNSADQALLSLLVGGNFAEIKSTVFKKYNPVVLFNIVMSDTVERFKLAMFLSMILVLNVAQGGVTTSGLRAYGDMCLVVVVAELFADWTKHSFITKLNFIRSGAYREYGQVLARDVTGIGHEGVNLDHTHAVVKRMGMAQIPLVCVMTRWSREALRYAWMRSENKRSLASTGLCYGVRILGGEALDCGHDEDDASLPRWYDDGRGEVPRGVLLGCTVFLGYLVLLLVKVCFGFMLLNVAKNKLLFETKDKNDTGSSASAGGKEGGKSSDGGNVATAKCAKTERQRI